MSAFEPNRDRRYRAALALLVAMHVYARLNSEQRSRLEEGVRSLFRNGPYPYQTFLVWANDFDLAGYRAHAMPEAGFETGIEGLSWRDIQPFDAGDFRYFDLATDDAVARLRQFGVEVPAASSIGAKWLAEMKARFP